MCRDDGQVTDRQKHLGLVFDSRLSWDLQVSNLCKKMAYYLHLIQLYSKVFNYHIMKMLVDSLVFSYLTNALSVWGTSIKQQSVQRLVQFQNWGVRLLYNLGRMDHVMQYYGSTGWLPFPQLVMYHSLCLMFHKYHCDYGQGIPLKPPIQFGHLFGYNIHELKPLLHIFLRCHLSFSQHFFRLSVIKFWNSLPLDIRDHLHFSDYKNELKTFLLTGL